MHRSRPTAISRLGRRRSSIGDARAKTGISATPLHVSLSTSTKVDDMNSQGTPPTEELSTHSDDDACMHPFSRPAQSSLNAQKRNLQRRLSRRNSTEAPGIDRSPQGKERTDTETERPVRPARIALNAQKQAMERRMARRNSIETDISFDSSKHSALRISRRGSKAEVGHEETVVDSHVLVPMIPSVDHASTSSLDIKPKKERRSSLSGLHSFRLELKSEPSEKRRERRRASLAGATCTSTCADSLLSDRNTANGRRNSDGDDPKELPSNPPPQTPASSIYRGSSYSCLETLANESNNKPIEKSRSKRVEKRVSFSCDVR